MKKEYTNRYRYLLIISSLNIIFCAISAIPFIMHGEKGTELQKFKILDTKLDSVINYTINELYRTEEQRNRTMVIELNAITDTIDVVFSFYKDPDMISTHLLAVYNYRILGYITKNDMDILLLTNIFDIYDVWDKLCKFIKAEQQTKFFKYIYIRSWYLHSKYWDNGHMFEPLRWHFKYINGNFIKPYGRLGGD